MNQIKLTNISLVRLKKGKKRFEIACYKNKVLEYRNGIEKSLDEVLQIPSVFLNVSKGQSAPTAELKKAFPGMTQDEIVMEILTKGELQVGAKERDQQLEALQKEVVNIVASRLVDPTSKRVYTPGMIEKALDMLSSQGSQNHKESAKEDRGGAFDWQDDEDQVEIKPVFEVKKGAPGWTGVVATKNAKSQALEAMKALIANQPIPVARARMKLRITCSANVLKQGAKSTPGMTGGEEKAKSTVKDVILSFIEQVESQEVTGAEWEVVGFCEPGAFKGLGEFIGGETKGQGRVEVLDMAVTHED